MPEPNDYVAEVDRPAAGDHDPRQAGRDPPAAQPLHAPRRTSSATRRKGNSSAFRCPYHGWTFSNTGALLGYPFKQRLRRRASEDGARPRPRAARRRATTASCSAPSPRTARRCSSTSAPRPRPSTGSSRLSPTGEVELTAGWLKHKVKANWKMLLENETDGYHPQFVHASIFSVADSGIGDLYGEKSTAVAPRPRQRPHRERPAPGVPPHRRSRWAGSAPRPSEVPGLRARRCATAHGDDGRARSSSTARRT